MRNKGFYLLILSVFMSLSEQSTAAVQTIQDQKEQEKQAKLDELYAACMQQKKKDKLCDSVISAKQIGDDSVEFIKEYMNLTPTAYAMLTIANMMATGRFRIRTSSFISKKANHIYDYKTRDNSFTFIYEMTF